MNTFPIQPQVVLYTYLASCIAVLIFNIVYIFVNKFQSQKLERHVPDMVDEIMTQIHSHEQHDFMEELVQDAYVESLAKRLKSRRQLKVFELAMDQVVLQVPKEAVERYISPLRKVFISLSSSYEKRDGIEQAFFANMIHKFQIDRGYESYDALMETLVAMVVGKDVYVRENALKALYSIGNQEAVLNAWIKMQENNIYHSKHLLTDGLLSFTGDRLALAKLLFEKRELFDTRLVLPVFQFIRLFTDEYQAEFFEILQNDRMDMELRLEAIRYFRKYPYEPARATLQGYVCGRERVEWEFSALAASALASYPGKDSIDALKEGLKSSNWYIRLNSAEALVHELKVPKLDLFDVINGSDRYAREILQYISEKMELADYKL